jgi:hypothetical protein
MLDEEAAFAGCHDVRKHTADAESEERDRDGQEGEVVVENDGKNAGEGKLQDQGGQRREDDT